MSLVNWWNASQGQVSILPVARKEAVQLEQVVKVEYTWRLSTLIFHGRKNTYFVHVMGATNAKLNKFNMRYNNARRFFPEVIDFYQTELQAKMTRDLYNQLPHDLEHKVHESLHRGGYISDVEMTDEQRFTVKAFYDHHFPQGWSYYPGDVCPHGTYTGGCGIDWMCGPCESGDDGYVMENYPKVASFIKKRIRKILG